MNKASILFVAMTAISCAAFAGQPSGRACVAQARQDVLACREQCTEEFRSAKLLCHGVSDICGRQCLGHRESCIEDARQPFEDCLGSCRDTLQSAKGTCLDVCGDDTACRDACIDQAQADAFSCRDTCTEIFFSGGGEAAADQCRIEFRICVDACPADGPR